MLATSFYGRQILSIPTFNAKTVLPPFNMHLVTAPPAPSPRLPSSMIFFCSLAASQPSSSRSSTSSGRPFSKLSLSRSGKRPFTLFSRSIDTPPSRSEYTELIAEDGSGVPPWGCRSIANDKAEYVDEDADAGPLPLPSVFVALPFLEWPFGSLGRNEPPSCGICWDPMGVASLSWGGAGRLEGRCSLGSSDRAAFPSGFTGLALGEGGIPSVRRGVRDPELLRARGTGGLSSGAGEDIVRLFCPSQGRNNSFGSARAAASSSTGRRIQRQKRRQVRLGALEILESSTSYSSLGRSSVHAAQLRRSPAAVDPSRESRAAHGRASLNNTHREWEEERGERASSNQAKQEEKKVRWAALMEVRPEQNKRQDQLPPASVRAGPLLSRSPRAPARAHRRGDFTN